MNRQLIAFRRIRTTQPLEVVLQATEDAMRRLGGMLYRSGELITVQGGSSGVGTAFASDINATVSVRVKEPGEYEISCLITVTPNTLFWVCGIAGFFCLQPLWIVSLFYFIVDPQPTYQRALDQIELRS